MTPFTVTLAGRVHADLDLLTERAIARGLVPVLALLLRNAIHEMKTRPREWGDPVHNDSAFDTVGYYRPVLPWRVGVEYVVHNTRPLVWLTALPVLEDSPFA